MFVGDKIKSAREAAKITQEELGARIGVSGVTIMRYEKGQREPSVERLFDLSQALKVSMTYLLGVVDERGFIMPEGFGDPEDYEFIRALGLDDPQVRKRLFQYVPPAAGKRELLLSVFDRLNDAGQDKAVERVEELGEIPKYQRIVLPADDAGQNGQS